MIWKVEFSRSGNSNWKSRNVKKCGRMSKIQIENPEMTKSVINSNWISGKVKKCGKIQIPRILYRVSPCHTYFCTLKNISRFPLTEKPIQIANLCFFPGNPAKPDESFGGDFYKDFYYSQGDYSQEEAQETKEMKKKKTKA